MADSDSPAMETPAANDAAQELTPAQQAALEQFVAVTNGSEAEAIALLARSHWSVPIAIAKFFDGDDPALEGNPNDEQAQPRAARPPAFENLQESLHAAHENAAHFNTLNNLNHGHRAPAERTEPARRIVPPIANPIWRPPFLIAVLLSPFNLGYRLLAGLWGAVQYLVSFLPRTRTQAAATAATTASKYGRRQLSPRDAAARFKREFEETYGTSELPFAEEGYTQAYDRAKREPLMLLVVLLSPEHDDTEPFVRETLLAPDVREVIGDPANKILLWGGNVRDAEAFQVASEFQCTKFPFSAVVSVTPKEGGNTRMGTVKRMVGRIPPQLYAANLRTIIRKYADDLAAVHAERIAQEATRNLRREQDSAYERSLARDRERARQRQQEEAAAAEAQRQEAARVAEAARQAKLAKQWRTWRKSQLAPEPLAGTPDMVRVALKMPAARGGQRVRRSFAKDATVEDLYAFVECEDLGDAEDEENGEDDEEEEIVSEKITKPEGYTHVYKFRIVSVMPREVHEPSESKTLLEAIGKSASLVVEELEEDSDEEQE